MKQLLILLICLCFLGCAAQKPIVSSDKMESEIIISKDDLREEDIPIFEVLPNQDDIENDQKQIRITYANGQTGIVTLQQGYAGLAQLLYQIGYSMTAYNKVVHRLIQIHEANVGLEVEPPPFLELYKSVPYIHQREQQE